jgi:DNA (cytosine-5)-methyltransferase 1
MAGKREGADDARDGWPATLAAVERVRPTWFIIENVIGAPVKEWAAAVALLGYTVSYRILDAADWGLPSHRRRVFLVGGPREYRWPRQTHCDPKTPFFFRIGLRDWCGSGPVLGLAQGWIEYNPPPTDLARNVVYPVSEPAPTLMTPGFNHLLDISLANNQSRKKFQAIPDTGYGRRRLTPRECGLLVGFPEAHPFTGPVSSKYRQAGNCVAPAMAEALGRAIMEQA